MLYLSVYLLINNLTYADDTTLLCESKEDLMELLTCIQHLSKEKGLLLNTRKTKIMVVDKNRTDDHKFILNVVQRHSKKYETNCSNCSKSTKIGTHVD